MNDFKKDIEFIRVIDIDHCNTELKLIQHSVGDVGCVVWDAGLVLGKYLDHKENSEDSIKGKVAIDIGAGTGVAGLFAAALGAKVILTDLPEIIPILENNIAVNNGVLDGSASALVLKWGESVAHLPTPDMILVSDCIYYEMSVKQLIPTLRDLASSNTEVLISYEDRVLGGKKNLLKSFLDALKELFDIEIIPATQQHPDYQSSDIHLLKCKKKSGELE